MPDDSKRPKWDFNGVSEPLFRWIVSHPIVGLEAGWKMTGVDTSTEWVMLIASNGEERRVTNPGFGKPCVWDYIEFNRSGGHRIVRYTDAGQRACERIRKIDAFDEAHAAEKAEYERLKEKFGDA